ncbi:extracellular solute-binding protein [Gracilibacillus oryzae]|uniref:Extracellular solute-binding protein n=1 Tax=Gracilibacillus oryzae TaxID=1672701 RepID=A0A7C8KQ20_9BACI|nr:sugar ABC transporter substrate-binding protein [Gracilibacillus oryzae]KAB8126544.1 extracellular solute-binding protein [Gracilibacillus oryzae]
MKKIKWIMIASLLVCFAFIMTACGSNSASSSEEPLKIWAMGAEGQKLKEFAKNFEEEHGIKTDVLAVPWGDAHDKILTAVAAGEGPDVLQIGNTWVAEFGEAGTFLDLTEYVESEEYPNLNQDNFFPSSTQTTVYNDKVLAVPYIIDTRVLFYRTDLLEQAGYPDGPATWDETLDAARTLAARGPDKNGFEIDQGSHHIPMMFAWEHGWDYDISKGAENFADPKFKQAMELYHQLFDEDLAQLEAGKETVQAFADGTNPMFISGPYMVNTIKEQAPEIEGKWNVKVMPKAETSNSIAGGSHFSVFHSSERVEDALTFINYMADPETQVEWYKEAFTLPTVKAAWEDPALKNDPMIKVFGEQIEMTKAFPVMAEYEFMAKELLKTLEQINRGGKSVDEALAEYQKEVEKILSE